MAASDVHNPLRLNVLLLSKTGLGKSSLVNALTQTSICKVSKSMASETAKCQCVVRNTKDYSLTVVDTPGSMDTTDPDSALLEMCTAIEYCPDGFHAVLLVVRLDVRLTKEERIAIGLLEKLFGNVVFRYCIIVFTHGDHLDNDEVAFINCIASDRKKLPELHDILIKCSNRKLMVDTSENANKTTQTEQIETLILLITSLSQRDNPILTGKYFRLAKQYLDEEKKKQEESKKHLNKPGVVERLPTCTQENRENLEEQERRRAAERLVQVVKKDGKACFPSGAMVQTPDGPIPINLLSVGQSVLCSYNNKLIYSPVYMWGHRDETTCSNSFVTITTESAQLTLSSDHLLPIIDEMGDEVSVPAGEVSSGNTVQVLHHMHEKSQEIRSEKVLSVETGVNRAGLFAPFTMCGTVIVDDVVASCYIRCLPHGVSHALLWPVRVGWRFSPSAVSFCNELESDGMCWWVRVISNRVLPMVKWLGVGSDGKSWLMSVISNGMFYSNPACQFK